MKYEYIMIALIIVMAVELVYICDINLMYLQTSPEITLLSSTAKTFTFEWDGSNATLNIVGKSENITIAVTNEQKFLCDRSTNIYKNGKLIFHVP
jgi:hypothetical protein